LQSWPLRTAIVIGVLASRTITTLAIGIAALYIALFVVMAIVATIAIVPGA
jgi:hypothetical protein